MELATRRVEKLETACNALLELIELVPSSPLPLKAYVGIAVKWEEAHDGRLRALARKD